MLKVEKTQVFGWEPAIRGMRNPMESWDRSDSHPYKFGNMGDADTYEANLKVGDADLELMMKLCKAGSDHRKFMRMLVVYADITAPLYWWKEYDTYKVGTVANSCSTMHTIHKKEFTLDDFSHEHLTLYDVDGEICRDWFGDLECLIDDLNLARELFLKTKDKKYWWQMIQLLPASFNQKRTVELNYESLSNMYHARKHHKLDEWNIMCGWIESLPHKELITTDFRTEWSKIE